MDKRLVVTLGLVTLVGAGVLFTSIASAQSNNPQHPMSLLSQKIAEKFGLNKDEVQAVVDDHHQQMHQEMKAQMQARHEEYLNELVKNGKITEEQKALIANKMKEVQKQRESEKDSFKNLTPEEMKKKMDQHRTELESWAKENGIDPQYLMGDFLMKVHGGPGKGVFFYRTEKFNH